MWSYPEALDSGTWKTGDWKLGIGNSIGSPRVLQCHLFGEPMSWSRRARSGGCSLPDVWSNGYPYS